MHRGQRQPEPRRRTMAHWGVLLMFLLSITGCTSTYHGVRSQMPPDAQTEFKLRLSEASQARNTVVKAAKTLRQNLERPQPAPVRTTSFDRLEAATLDFQRRVLTAGDAAERAGLPASGPTGLEDLRKQAEVWLSYLRDSRTMNPTLQLQRLRELLP